LRWIGDLFLPDIEVSVLTPIQKTKFFIPLVRAGLISRQRLIEQLNMGQDCKLTLISAPAGFGKTTLLSEWTASLKIPVTWISIDEGDNDPIRFLMGLIIALQKINPMVGSDILSILQSSQSSHANIPYETLLTSLINEIVEFPTAFTIVLDDYHLITEKSVQEIISYLLDNEPPQIHLVISGRADPVWPLARIRAQGEVNELRANDLRFTPEEAMAFLNKGMNLHLSLEESNALEDCTEGWIAALQMAAISMQGRSEVTSFIKAFTGSHRFVSDFLLEEVLSRQTLETREFLLKTSILERICAPLADSLMDTGEDWQEQEIKMTVSSQVMLDTLEHSNLFLIPLDDERHWYRYHHLFRDLLRSNLTTTHSDLVNLLHQKASEWYGNARLFDDAIGHAFASQDFEWTASLIEKAASEIDIENKLVVISTWIANLPEGLVEKRPWLCVYRAWGQQWVGQRTQVAQSLGLAETALDANRQARETGQINPGNNLISEDGEKHIRGHIAAIRAHAALVGEDIPRVLEMGEQALALLPQCDEMRCETGVALGGAYWALGDVHKSEKSFAMARADALKCAYTSMAVPASCYMGMQQTKQARLAEAIATYRDALHLATGENGKENPAAGFPNTKLGDLLRECNLLEAAKPHLERGVEQCVLLGQADVLADAYVCLSRLQITLGDYSEAHENLSKADAVMQKTKVDPFVVCWKDDCQIRLWLAEGRLDDAANWAETCGLQIEGSLSYHYDLHHINLARILVALGMQHPTQSYLVQVSPLLDRLLNAAQTAGWVHEVIKILILKALTRQASNDNEEATLAILDALRLAEPGGYVRTFVDEGEAMQRLLEGCIGIGEPHPRLADYTLNLLKIISSGLRIESPEHKKLKTPVISAKKAPLPEALTERELDVLRLLNSGLTSNEIAVELYLSVHTVRTHIKNIYGKLGVNRRIEAVHKARDLKLL
jgi:LuxR family transcriptional regulator, maltose regulon positive regulatory protein